MIRQLAEAMGYDLPALTATPEQVWAGLLDEIERQRRSGILFYETATEPQ
jgi:hypothetical protein